MIAGMTYYQICWFFVLYSFLGWVIEVAYHAVTLGKVVNRGFLNGPVCPVYGFGMLAVLSVGNAAETATAGQTFSMSGGDELSTFFLFLGGMVLTTAVELIGGWALDVLFHTRWWDYSSQPLNFHGYICLKFSIIWGLAVVLVVRVVHPILQKDSAGMVPERYGWPILAVLYAAYLADLVVTVLTIVGLNKKLAELNKLRSSMRVVSDGVSEVVAETTLKTAQTIQEGQVQAALAKAELRDAAREKKAEIAQGASERKAAMEQNAASHKAAINGKKAEIAQNTAAHRAAVEARAEEILQKFTGRHSMARRLMRAFPDMKHRDYDETLSDIRERIRRG